MASLAQSGGVCYSHGGGKRCANQSCTHAARSGGYCIKHGKLLKQMEQTEREQTDVELDYVADTLASMNELEDPRTDGRHW